MGAEIPDGAVLIARAIVNSSLWEMRPPDRIVAITCITLANRRRKKWFDGQRDIWIERGQFVRSREQMVDACKLPLQVVRTSLEHLEVTKFLTRFLTRSYTLYTIPKYQHYQDLTKYSDNLSTENQENQPGFQPDANHKQQQQTTPQSDPNKTGPRRGDGIGAVVVVDPDRWPDPILGKPSFRIAFKLLEEIHMAPSIANAFAAQKPIGQVLRVVQQARLQKKPAGWARMALELNWVLPEAAGNELAEVINIVKNDVERLNAYFLTHTGVAGVKMSLPARRPDEDERSWFKRVNDELKRRKTGQRNGGGGAAEKT